MYYTEEVSKYKNKTLSKKISVHLKANRSTADRRYMPEVNVDTKVLDFYGWQIKNKSYYSELGGYLMDLNRETRRYYSDIQKIKVARNKKITLYARQPINELQACLDLKFYEDVDYRKLISSINFFLDKLYKTDSIIREYKTKKEIEHKEEQEISSFLNSSSELERTLHELKNLCESVAAKLAQGSGLLLHGEAGIGKTHLLCDLTERINKENGLALLHFAEDIYSIEEYWNKVGTTLGIRNPNKSKVLVFLENQAKKRKLKSILIIDAINEAPTKPQKIFSSVISELENNPYITFTLSVRNGFSETSLFQKDRKKLIAYEHTGFAQVEWNAIKKFFTRYEIPLPEVPIVHTQFRNPLFLYLFCKAFEKKKKDKEKKKKNGGVFKGTEGQTYIYEEFIERGLERVINNLNLKKSDYDLIWRKVFKEIAKKMVKTEIDRISEFDAINIVKSAYPHLSPQIFLKELEVNGFLSKQPTVEPTTGKIVGYSYRYTFQRFSDHLIVRYILKEFELFCGKGNMSLEKAIEYFDQDYSDIGKYIHTSHNSGVYQALAIQFPEWVQGVEFFECVPKLYDRYHFLEPTISSIKWREKKSFKLKNKKLFDYLNFHINKGSNTAEEFWEAVFSVAALPEHPLNGDFLHRYLSKMSMANRDSWWIEFINDYSDDGQIINRIIEWPLITDQEISEESRLLFAQTLLWLTITTNQHVRDISTKSLVEIGTNHLEIFEKLLNKFNTVDDLYLHERLYSAIYGAMLRTNNSSQRGIKRELARRVYKEIFKNDLPLRNILIRDYARNIIDHAQRVCKPFQFSKKKINPPYKSVFNPKVPSLKVLEKKFPKRDEKNENYSSLWWSIMYSGGALGDFGKHQIKPAVSCWSNKRIKSREIKDDKQKLDTFVDALSKKSRNQYDAVMEAAFECRFNGWFDDQENKKIPDWKKFKKTLTPSKKKQFVSKFEPMINLRGGHISNLQKDFPPEIAERWLFNKVIKLGWNPDLHSNYDRRISRYSRGSYSSTIGEKYAFIALYELLAYLSDNYMFNGRYTMDETDYKGPWQIYQRNIDPSFISKRILKNPKYHKEISLFKEEFILNQRKCKDYARWVKNEKNIISPDKALIKNDVDGVKWVLLEGSKSWQDEVLGKKEYDVPSRRISYLFSSYFVKNKDDATYKKLSRSKQWGLGFKEHSSPDLPVFIGEYHSSIPYEYYNVPYFHHDNWFKLQSKSIKEKFILTTDSYDITDSNDRSTPEGDGFFMPSEFLFKKLKIRHKHLDGFYYIGTELVAFDMQQAGLGQRGIVIKEEILKKFLKKNNLDIVWVIYIDKMIMGGGMGKYPYRDYGGYFSYKKYLKGIKGSCFRIRR